MREFYIQSSIISIISFISVLYPTRLEIIQHNLKKYGQVAVVGVFCTFIMVNKNRVKN